MSWQFGIFPIQVILAIFSLVTLVTAPWTLTIDNLFWKILVMALSSCILFVTLLSIGLMPYFGQREITRECQRQSGNFEKWMWEARHKAEGLEKENAELKQQLKHTS